MLRSIVTMGYLGFIAYSSSFALRKYVYVDTDSKVDSVTLPTAAGAAIFAAFAIRFFAEKAPSSYYVYAAFPCFFWSSVLSSAYPFKVLWRDIAASVGSGRKLIGGSLAIITTLQVMVWGYARREVFSALLVAMGVLWPALLIDRSVVRGNFSLVAAWTASCLALAVFPMLPVEKGESIVIM
jgi:phosphatidylinositol glycan class N